MSEMKEKLKELGSFYNSIVFRSTWFDSQRSLGFSLKNAKYDYKLTYYTPDINSFCGGENSYTVSISHELANRLGEEVLKEYSLEDVQKPSEVLEDILNALEKDYNVDRSVAIELLRPHTKYYLGGVL